MRQNQPLLIRSVTPVPPQANITIIISEIIGSAWAEAWEEGLRSNTDHTDLQQLGTEVWKKLRHLILVVKERIDTRSGTSVPDLHTLVRRAGRSRGQILFNAFYFFSFRWKSCHLFEVLPWDKVSVIWGEGYIKNPGPMSTQRASQVSMLPVKENHECWFASFLILCTSYYTFVLKNTSSFI